MTRWLFPVFVKLLHLFMYNMCAFRYCLSKTWLSDLINVQYKCEYMKAEEFIHQPTAAGYILNPAYPGGYLQDVAARFSPKISLTLSLYRVVVNPHSCISFSILLVFNVFPVHCDQPQCITAAAAAAAAHSHL